MKLSRAALCVAVSTIASFASSVSAETIIGWDVRGVSSYGTQGMAPTTLANHLSAVGLTRGTGVGTVSTTTVGGWGGSSWTTTDSADDAIANGDYITFSLTTAAGHTASITSLDRFDYSRSASGAKKGVLQFQVGSGSYSDLNAFTYSEGAGGTIGLASPIDLTGVAGLQNIPAQTTVTFRIVNFNASGTGNWFIYDKLGTTAADLAFGGTVSAIQAVPEPLTAAGVGLLCLRVLGRRMR